VSGEQVTSFFELVADASVFEGAFSKAQAKAVEFAGAFKASAASVEADANKMGSAIERGIATGSLSRSSANAMINDRLKFYGAGGASGSIAADATGGGGLGIVGLQAAAFGLVALAGAASTMLGVTQHLVEQQAAFSSELLRNSEAIGMNTADLQTWEKIASVVGIDQQSMTLDFERFAKNLNDGAPALKAAGTSLKDIGVTSTDVGTAILQVADYFHTHSDQAQKAAIAMALFGRSGAELIPILDQGSAAVSQYKSQLEAMGVILSNSQLVQGAQAQAAITNLTTAFDTAKSELVGGALPGFTVFFQTLSVIMQNNAATWVAIGQTIGNVVTFITGLVAGIAGVDISTMLAAPTDAGAAYQGLGAGAAGAASGMDQAAQAAKSATDALDDQIRVLNDQKRAEDDLLDTQKQALQAQLDTLHDVNDSRRRAGEDIVSYERRLEELKLNDQIKAIDTQKTNYDRGVTDQIAALNDQKAAVKDASGAMAADLSGGMATGMAGLNANLATGMSKAELALLDKAHQMGKDIAGIFSDNPGTQKKAAEHLGEILGGALGDGIKAGLLNWLGREIVNSANGPAGLAGIGGQVLSGVFTGMVDQLTGHATGYFGSTPHLAMISEGGSPEVVLPLNNRSRSLSLMEQSGMADLARSAGGGGGQGGGISIQIGTVIANDPTEIARMGRALKDEARRRGLALTGGFG
jgi:hypothetical protein